MAFIDAEERGWGRKEGNAVGVCGSARGWKHPYPPESDSAGDGFDRL